MKLFQLQNFFLVLIYFQIITVNGAGLNKEFSWTRINYAWDSENPGQLASRFGYESSTYQNSGQRVGYSTSVSSSVSMSQAGSSPVPVPSQGSYNSGSNTGGKRPQKVEVVEVPYTNWNGNQKGDSNRGNSGNGRSYGSGGSSGSYGSASTNTGNRDSGTLIEGGTSGNVGQNFRPNEQNTNYNYVTNIPMGANVWQNKLFITVPRRRMGVPSTLNYVPLNSKERHNVPLIPYPSWTQNAYPDRTGRGENFVSVYRVAVDICDRLWFVDTGIVETLGNRTVAKPHELVVIDLQTNKILHRYSLPDSVVTSATVLASLTVDSSKDDCGNAYVYFPDLAGYGLIVYSLRENKAWRVTHNYFYLEPQAGEFRISGHEFQWNDGIFSVELSDKNPDGFRDLYFHSMAGTHMYKVSTKILRNETLATRSYHDDDFQVVGDRGPNSQTSSADIHKQSNVMFLGLVNQNALGCWNINNDLKTISIVQKDDEKMIYPSDVKVAGDKVYVLTNTMPEFLYGQLDYDRTNFRVWSNDVSSAISGTKCQKKASNGY